MRINEFLDNSDFLLAVRSTFYYYDGKWNFPHGDDIGFNIIENTTNKKLDDKTKNKIIKIEKYLNNNDISYEDIDTIFSKIWFEL
jgi:hypothetical protein